MDEYGWVADLVSPRMGEPMVTGEMAPPSYEEMGEVEEYLPEAAGNDVEESPPVATTDAE